MKSQLSKFVTLSSAVVLVAAGLAFANQSSASAEPSANLLNSTTPGAIGSVTIPAGVTEVTFSIQAGNGAQGQGACAGAGGLGAVMSGTLAVEPGDEITYVVGANGTNGGEFGGGDGGTVGGGAGGDATYLYLNGEDNSDIVAVAGAGGGGAGGEENSECVYYGGAGGTAGVSGLPGSAGTTGYDYYDTSIGAGAGGTSSGAGAGGTYFPPVSEGNNGNGLDGGAGGDGDSMDNSGGGGGGAGFYGGGGGAGGVKAGSGGGAGAGYYNSEVVTNQIHETAFDGSVHAIINYDAPESETTTAPATTVAQATPPNNGDGNGDGTKDADQSNVHTTLTNLNGPKGNTWVTFVHPQACTYESGFVGAEDDFQSKDSAYDYPANFYGFEIACPTSTVTVDMYFHNLNGTAKDYVARKYLSYNDTYVTIEGASVSDVNIAGNNVVKVSYSVTDGGKYDIDQVVNGTIIDPASIAYSPSAQALPTTGSNTAKNLYIGYVLVLSGGAMVVFSLKKRRKLI